LTEADKIVLAGYAASGIAVGARDTLCFVMSVSVDAASNFTRLIILDLIVTVLRTTCLTDGNRIIRPMDSISEG